MRFYADLHIHSKYSRACSRDGDIEHLAWWARRKGITVVGTGDVTHPAWFQHLQEVLEPAEPGLLRLRPDLDTALARTLPATCARTVRFMLSAEIATIYKSGQHTRKIHHLIYLPDFAAAAEFNRRLGRIGNLGSDGRPILGLDSRDLLEITLECSPDAYLVPAHLWTPWFSVLGSKAGFNSIEECYRDLADEIFAVETGLSSDPEMNWRVSQLDRYRLVSNSDAHSPPMLGREASVFDTDLDYYAIRRALETGDGYAGSVEFFPEEGKYHLDGHRKCGVCWTPPQTRAHDGRCPQCGTPVTVGVLNRVDELADRPEGGRPAHVDAFRSLIPLPEIVGELLGVGPKSKRVRAEIDTLTAYHGPELQILEDVPVQELRGVPELSEAISRLRHGDVVRDGGYDGEYGTIRVFRRDELQHRRTMRAPALFHAEPAATPPPSAPTAPQPEPPAPTAAPTPPTRPPADPTDLLDGLDPQQRSAAVHAEGPLLILAGPGTGKTRTLTHRMAHLVADRDTPAEQCLALTFTRRAADEMTDRLTTLLGDRAADITVATFHSLGLQMLRAHPHQAGLSAHFTVADTQHRDEILTELFGDRPARRDAAALSHARRAGTPDDPALATDLVRYVQALRRRDLVDFDDLVALPVELLADDPDLAEQWRARFRHIAVDEYQDVDENQYHLLRQLAPDDAHLTAIGDPDQAIYGFRGADVGYFLRFQQDYPQAHTVHLTRNYRSGAHILTGATRAVAPTTLVPDRALRPAGDLATHRIGVHQTADETAEASFITAAIDTLLGGSSFHSLDSGRASGQAADGIGFGDIAVLYRTSSQAAPLIEALTRAGYPFQRYTHDPLTARPGVGALLRELHHPGHRDTDVVTAVHRAATAVLTRPTDATQDRTRELHAAVELLTPLARRCGDDLDQFRHELLLGAEADAWDPRADRIALLTLHAAKGLEFPAVFLAGCEDGLLPLRWPGSDVDGLAEERRLFFVGMTRAQQHLYLTHAQRRRGEYRSRSRFVDALGSDVTEHPTSTRRRTRPQARQLSLL